MSDRIKEKCDREENMKDSIVRRVEKEEHAFRIVERMVLSDSVEQHFLVDVGKFITVSQYKDVVEERAISKLCGYALCCNRLTQVLKQKYKISLKEKKVYDITDRKNFCSNACYKASKYFESQLLAEPVWMRDDKPNMELKLFGEDEHLNEISLNNFSGSGEEVITKKNLVLYSSQELSGKSKECPESAEDDGFDVDEETCFGMLDVCTSDSARVIDHDDFDHDDKNCDNYDYDHDEQHNDNFGVTAESNIDGAGIDDVINDNDDDDDGDHDDVIGSFSRNNVDNNCDDVYRICEHRNDGDNGVGADDHIPAEDNVDGNDGKCGNVAGCTNENLRRTSINLDTHALSDVMNTFCETHNVDSDDSIDSDDDDEACHIDKPDEFTNTFEQRKRVGDCNSVLVAPQRVESSEVKQTRTKVQGDSSNDSEHVKHGNRKNKKIFDLQGTKTSSNLGCFDEGGAMLPKPGQSDPKSNCHVENVYKTLCEWCSSETWRYCMGAVSTLKTNESKGSDEHFRTVGKKVEKQFSTKKKPQIIPAITSKNPITIRGKIVTEKLTRALRPVVSKLGIAFHDIEMSDILKTFRFSSSNIVLKPTEWTLVALVILHTLQQCDSSVKTLLIARQDILHSLLDDANVTQEQLELLVNIFMREETMSVAKPVDPSNFNMEELD